MFALYITHPQIKLDPAIPVPQWGLSDLGRARAMSAAQSGWAARLSRIVSSDERKAIETAEILAGARPGLSIEIVEGLHENDRSATGFLPPDAFEEAANWFFSHPEESYRGWERAVDAQARIVSKVTALLDAQNPDEPIAFVGHGGVGTLLKCHFSQSPISRDGDQPAGGGNLFCLRLADRTLTCDWTRMEDWTG